jgi:ABC-type transport system involved in multi-copper enzyme maturation permease subunit
MTVFGAMLLDAYRELNAKKLFWITLVLSAVVVIGYASVGFNASGTSIFFGLWNIESDIVKAGSPIAKLLYESIFATFIVGLWLAWVATILALISTTTIFPDFIAGGSVDLVLSKPIHRTSIFLMKYVSSLLFVLLQVSVFCVGVFACIRWRLGEWNWMIFTAIPVVTLFYSYLYSVNVLIGILTRSALTALLITMLFWASLFSLNTADVLVTQFHTMATIGAEENQENLTSLKTRLSEMDDADRAGPAGKRLSSQIADQQQELQSTERGATTLGKWQQPLRWAQFVLPKTSETIALLDRWLKKDIQVTLTDLMSGNITTNAEGKFVPLSQNQDREVTRRLEQEYGNRSLWYVIGTSLLFEAVMLTLAAFVFVRRDY